MKLEKFIRDLSPELQEKARRCVSTDDLSALAKAENVELSPEALAAIAGGKSNPQNCMDYYTCKKCGSKNVTTSIEDLGLLKRCHCRCCDCGYKWYFDYDPVDP